jgi:hypothetical protein
MGIDPGIGLGHDAHAFTQTPTHQQGLLMYEFGRMLADSMRGMRQMRRASKPSITK